MCPYLFPEDLPNGLETVADLRGSHQLKWDLVRSGYHQEVIRIAHIYIDCSARDVVDTVKISKMKLAYLKNDACIILYL